MQTVINSETQQNPILTQAYENLVDFVMNEADTIENAHARFFGVSAWYKAFLLSDEFSALSKEQKQESFELYEDVLNFFKIAADYGADIDEKERELFGEKKFR